MAEGRVSIETDVVFGTGGGRDLRCDIYTPPGDVESAPAIILVHGGAWRQGDRTQLRGYGVLLGREGYVCIAPEYRLTPEAPWPAQIHDVKAAIRWVRANADRLGVDPDRIAIEGNSAGAHLALLAAGTTGLAAFEGEGGNPGVSTHVSAVLGVYAPTIFSNGERERGAVPLLALSDERSDDVATLAGPISHVSADFPPTLLIHGTHDTTVPALASIRMYEALIAAKVPAELHMYAEQPHAFDAQPAFGRQCAAEMLLFLERYVRSPETFAAAAAMLAPANPEVPAV
ncbi:MAG: alpha/beta hydrolase [Acidimicrobiia bacterium]|nr:alpha/beta hydrolase [Acidimicrobiia bacterium]